MSKQAFIPKIDIGTKTQTCIQKTSANATANVALGCQNFLVKCHTYAVYIRLGPGTVEVTSSNGYYMAAGDERELQASNGASHLAVINATTDENGVISIMPGYDT